MGLERGRALGMPLAEFTEKAYAGLVQGKEEIIIGQLAGCSEEDTHAFLARRAELFDAISKQLMVHFKP